MESSSRIAEARRRVKLARYVLGAGAVAGLAVFGAAARDAHPATHQVVQPSSSESDESSSTFSFGGSSLGGAGSSAPQVQSGGS